MSIGRATLDKPKLMTYNRMILLYIYYLSKSQRNDLQERSEGITNKAKSLAAEILEVKERLAEAKARNMAGKGSMESVYNLVNLYLITVVYNILSFLSHSTSFDSNSNHQIKEKPK